MTDHFERLGLPRRFSVDPAAVERAYLDRSRELHPDRHQLAPAAEQRASLELTAALNEAYLTLRDPFRRGEYLLKLHGGPTAQQEKNLDQAFLMEMMDVRERIEGDGPTDDIERELVARLAALSDEVGGRFDMLDEAADRAAVLVTIRRRLNAAKTVQSLLRDLRTD